MIKILQVVISLDPGGLENGVVNIANGLPPAEFETHICCLERRGNFSARLKHPENVAVLEKQPGVSTRTAIRLARIVKYLHPDVLHTHRLGPLIYACLARLFGPSIPILHGEHGQLTGRDLSPRKFLLRRCLFPLCKQVHTVSDDLRDHLISFGFSAEHIISIRNGVNTEVFVPGNVSRSRAALGLPIEGVFLGIAARISQGKNHPLLIDAFSRLANRRSDAHLLIVGDGPDRLKVEELAQNSPFSDRIHIIGHRDDIAVCYQAMNLMILPSSGEGLSNSVLECMSCGVPVMASCACGNSEMIDHDSNGFLVRIDNAESLACDIGLVLDRGNLSSIGKNSRRTVIQRFSVEQMINEYARVYKRVGSIN